MVKVKMSIKYECGLFVTIDIVGFMLLPPNQIELPACPNHGKQCKKFEEKINL